jgi:hypothetical protein
MKFNRRGVLRLIAALVVLAGLTALILLRVPILEAVAMRALAWRGIEAQLDLRTFDFDRAVVERLRLGSTDAPAVAAARIEARYNLFGLFRGRLRSVAIDGLEVRVTVDGAGARLEGVPLSVGGGGGGGRPARTPEVTIPDGRLYVATPAGELIGDIALSGGPDSGWRAHVEAEPAQLGRGASALVLGEGVLDASIASQALSLSSTVRLASVSHDGAIAENVTAEASFDGRYDDATRLAGLQGTGRAALTLGDARLDDEAAANWAERLAPVLDGAGGEAVGPLLASLRTALAAALAELVGEARFDVAVAEGKATFAPAGEAVLLAADGGRLAFSSATDVGGAIVIDAGAAAVSARDLSVAADLGDVFDARLIVTDASFAQDRTGLIGDAVATFALAPWTAEGLTLAADGRRLRLTTAQKAWTAEIEAELRAGGGTRFGLSAEDLVARLDLVAAGGAAGVTVSPRAAALQAVTAASLSWGGYRFESVETGLAPLTAEDPLLRFDGQGTVFGTRAADFGAGVEILGLRWAALLPAAELVVRAPKDGAASVRAYVQAPRFEGRAEERSAVAQASVIEAEASFDPDSRARLRFEGLSLSGSALPVSVANAAGEAEATLVEGKPAEGRVALAGVEISDAAEIDRITPLTISGDAPITDGVLGGALQAVDSMGRTVVTIDVSHDFKSGAGEVVAATPRFVFAENSFQPEDVFPILQGPVVNASGAASAEGRFGWGASGNRASGALVLDNIAFDMQFGHVGGLSTRFEVADLLKVRTNRAQRIDIGIIDPGLPLENGVIELELMGPTRLRLDSARFPFAGGAITAAPAEIDLAAERKLVLLLAQSISLDQLAAMFKPPNLVVTGSLSGRIPIEARDRSVFIVDGELTSDAPGRIAYTGRAGEGLARQNESTRLAFDALTNFQYDRLTLSIDGDVAGRLQADVKLEGKNPDVLEGYPINFNLNTSAEFANLLSQAFRGASLSAAARGGSTETLEEEAETPPAP